MAYAWFTLAAEQSLPEADKNARFTLQQLNEDQQQQAIEQLQTLRSSLQ